MKRAGFAALSLFAALANSGELIPVHGVVTGSSGKHPVLVALWDPSGFLSKPLRTARFEPGQHVEFRFDVPAGRYAVSAFEDVNGNGKLDVGLFGPQKPSGFFKPFCARRAPRFDDVSFDLSSASTNADVALK